MVPLGVSSDVQSPLALTSLATPQSIVGRVTLVVAKVLELRIARRTVISVNTIPSVNSVKEIGYKNRH